MAARVRPFPAADLERAWSLCRTYHYEPAERLFLSLQRRYPALSEVPLGLGALYRYQGRLDKAIGCLRRAQRLRPGDPRASLSLGQLYIDAGRIAPARRAFERAAVSGRSVRAHLLLGRLWWDAGDSAKSRQCFRAAARASGESDNAAQVPLDKLEANMLSGEFEAAFANAEELFRKDSTQRCLETLKMAFGVVAAGAKADARPPKFLGNLCARRRWPSSATASWAALVAAYTLDGLGRRDEALRWADRLRSAPAGCRWMRFVRAEISYPRADEDDLEASYAEAPGLWNARAMQGELAFRRGSRARAYAIFQRLIATLSGPARADAVAWRGELRLWAGDYARAQADFEAAISGGARFARGWLGAALACRGNLAAAGKELDASLSVDPLDPEILTWRGEVRRRLGRKDEALKDLDAAIALNGSYWAAINRALVRLSQGRVGDALGDLSLLPADIKCFLGGGTPDHVRRGLEKALKRARGLRRAENDLWIKGARRAPRGARNP